MCKKHIIYTLWVSCGENRSPVSKEEGVITERAEEKLTFNFFLIPYFA
ncbi:MAG: hypothetical protein MW690_001628 [Methanophagales archaeon]|nr:hypothetical protein [Methanophagales archaeon]